MNTENKIKEITEFTKNRVEEIHNYDPDKLNDISELHHEIFNTDYYIIGRYQAQKWLGEDTFDCIAKIVEYEETNFGETYTDFVEPERVVNMYVYIIGEEILSDVVEEYLEDFNEEEEPSEEIGVSEAYNLFFGGDQ